MIYEIILIVLTLIAAVFAVESREILRAIFGFLVMSILVALIFFALTAYYAAVFQLLIYAGAIVVLLLISFHVIER